MESKKEFIERMLNVPLYFDPDGKPVDMLTWAANDRKHRIVAYDDINCYRVSTVFLGINLSLGWGGPPLIYETMIFGPEGSPLNLWMDRYCNKEQALHGHVYACRLASGELKEE